jgi:ubiquinone/menaquinone biosynthesis C-methylase UbiE
MKFISGVRIPLSEDSFIDAELAKSYDEHSRRFMGLIYRRIAARAGKIHIAGNRVLDIGAGSGRLTVTLARVRPEWQVTGIDISEEMLKLARENAVKDGLADRVSFQQAGASALPFTDSSFNLVVSNASLHLWKDPSIVFKEIARVTAPGGYCLIRDNLRLAVMNPFFSLVGRLMGMNAAQCDLWLKAIHSSYTPGEVKTLLKETPLHHARVTVAPGFYELAIEWKRLQSP